MPSKTELSGVTLVGRIRVLYFLEDRAQEGFIRALVERIASDRSIPADSLIHDIRSARHGHRVLSQFKTFLKDTKKIRAPDVDVLVIAIDGNCKGYNDRVKELRKYTSNHPLENRIVYAVPDPHIERWYLIDQKAFKEGIGLTNVPNLPAYKCKRKYYKQFLSRALKDSDIHSLLGGTEYAEKIVAKIGSLFSRSLADKDVGFQRFVEDLGSILERTKKLQS